MKSFKSFLSIVMSIVSSLVCIAYFPADIFADQVASVPNGVVISGINTDTITILAENTSGFSSEFVVDDIVYAGIFIKAPSRAKSVVITGKVYTDDDSNFESESAGGTPLDTYNSSKGWISYFPIGKVVDNDKFVRFAYGATWEREYKWDTGASTNIKIVRQKPQTNAALVSEVISDLASDTPSVSSEAIPIFLEDIFNELTKTEYNKLISSLSSDADTLSDLDTVLNNMDDISINYSSNADAKIIGSSLLLLPKLKLNDEFNLTSFRPISLDITFDVLTSPEQNPYVNFMRNNFISNEYVRSFYSLDAYMIDDEKVMIQELPEALQISIPLPQSTAIFSNLSIITADYDMNISRCESQKEDANIIFSASQCGIFAIAFKPVLAKIIQGDVNLDYSFNANDISAQNQFVLGNMEFSQSRGSYADSNNDQKVNVFDSLMLKRSLLK